MLKYVYNFLTSFALCVCTFVDVRVFVCKQNVCLCFTEFAENLICPQHKLLGKEDVHTEVSTQRELQKAESNKNYNLSTST